MLACLLSFCVNLPGDLPVPAARVMPDDGLKVLELRSFLAWSRSYSRSNYPVDLHPTLSSSTALHLRRATQRNGALEGLTLLFSSPTNAMLPLFHAQVVVYDIHDKTTAANKARSDER
jgi:hypothetical protein